jgi:hypothetical protein
MRNCDLRRVGQTEDGRLIFICLTHATEVIQGEECRGNVDRVVGRFM